MASSIEIGRKKIKQRPTARQVFWRVALASGLGVTGTTASLQASENLPGIEQKMAYDGAILDQLEIAGKAASFSGITHKVGGRDFPEGYQQPDMSRVEVNVFVAQLLARVKGGSEPIVDELQRVRDQAPHVGKKLGDTTGLQATIRRVAGQVNDEAEALNDRQNRNLFVKWFGGAAAVAYPIGALGLWMREKWAKRDEEQTGQADVTPADRAAEKQMRKTKIQEEIKAEDPVDVDEPGWIARKMAKEGKLLPK